MDHPTSAILRGFLLQALSQDEVRAVVAHLLPGCARCSAEIASLRKAFSHQKTLVKNIPTIGPSYDAAFEKTLSAALSQRSSAEPKRRSDLFQDYELKLPVQSHKLVVLYKDLLHESWSLRHQDPARMIHLARRAVLVADAMSPSRYGAKRIADWQCRAWAELGNAYRVTDDHEAAASALERSLEIFDRGSQDELLQARLFDLLASLSGARWQFETASGQLDFAYDLYLRQGDQHLAGRTLIKRGIFVGRSGEPDRGGYLIRRGLAWLDRDREPELVSMAFQSLAYFEKESGNLREAQEILRQRTGRAVRGHVGRLRINWLEGEIWCDLGEFDRAEQILCMVKHHFESAGLRYQAANVALNLETVWRRQGRKLEAESLRLEAEEVFR